MTTHIDITEHCTVWPSANDIAQTTGDGKKITEKMMGYWGRAMGTGRGDHAAWGWWFSTADIGLNIRVFPYEENLAFINGRSILYNNDGLDPQPTLALPSNSTVYIYIDVIYDGSGNVHQIRLDYRSSMEALSWPNTSYPIGKVTTNASTVTSIQHLRPATTGALAIGDIVARSVGELQSNSGWAACDGSHLDDATGWSWPDYRLVIGTTYGALDGMKAKLPDLRGRGLVGQDNMGSGAAGRLSWSSAIGTAGGTQTHTLTVAQMPAHAHTASASTNGGHAHNTTSSGQKRQNALISADHSGHSGSDGTFVKATGASGTSYNPNTSENGAHSHTITVNSNGSGAAHNIMQPSMVVAWHIYLGEYYG